MKLSSSEESLITQNFPFSKIRDQQAEALVFAIDSLKDKKFVIIEAGTGVGKSAIGVGLNRYLLHKECTEGFLPGAYFLTTQNPWIILYPPSEKQKYIFLEGIFFWIKVNNVAFQ